MVRVAKVIGVNKIGNVRFREKSMPKDKKEEPMIFRVLPGGTIESPGYGTPATREEAFALSRDDFQSAGRLAAQANDIQPIMWELQRQYHEYHQKKLDDFETDDEIEAYTKEWPEHADEVLAGNWVLQLSDKEFKKLRTQMEEWAKSEPNRMDETDYFQIPADGQDCAYKFFLDYAEPEVLDELDIDIVEGEHPGSTYYAAELSIPVEEANARAGKAGIPIRFEVGEE